MAIYEGREHSFFNYKDFEDHKNTLMKADRFMVSLGHLNNEPPVAIE